MHSCRLWGFAAHLLGAISLLAVASARADDNPVSAEEVRRGFRARTFLAKPRAGREGEVPAAEQRENLRLVRSHPRLGGIRTLETDGREEIPDVIARLQATGLYEYVEPDYLRHALAVPDDPRFASDQWALDNTGQSGGTPGADIRAAAAWELQREAPDVVVAVMDTGVRLIHPDLAANLWRNPAEFGARPAIDDDGNVYVDDHHGINATVARTSLLAGDPSDENGHGTHVAGIIGAVGNNGTGVTGVAWKVQIMALKFIGQRGGSTSAAVACLDYAIAKKAQIINGSYGATTYSQAEFDALKRARDAGIIFVAAAGNDSMEINEYPEYPAAYPLDNIVAVASTTRQDKLANYSTYGSGLVELAAPGTSILSLGISATAPYVTLSGTSMAAPHVAGALALLKQRFPNDNYRALINRLLSSVDPLPALDYKVHTNGRLNLLRALSTTDSRPFNDDFSRRAVITGDFNTVRGSNQYATREAGEPDHGVSGSGGSLWWSWTAPAGTGQVTITTAGSEFDTVLAVYALPAGTAPASSSGLTRVAFNDDTESARTSSVTFAATGGATYAIAIAGKGDATGALTFSLTSVPVNDAFAQARAVSGSSVVVTTSNANATVEAGEPKPRNSRGTLLGTDHSVWFRWTAPATHTYQISVYSEGMDPVLAVYTGTTLATLAEVASDDDSGPFTDAIVRLTATAGVTYHLKVDAAARAGGRFTLTIADAAWQYVADYPSYVSPSVAPDGTIYFGDSFGYVHAVNPGGTRKWRSAAVDGYIFSGSLAVGPDGTIYACDDFGYVYALNPANGAKKWEFGTRDFIWAAPAVAADGTLYVKSDDGFLYALAPDGTKKWEFAVPGDTYASPVIGADGTIYIPSGGDTALYAVTPEGTLKWRAPLGAEIYATPALGADGTIYLGNYDGRFFAIRPDGSERWRYDTGSPLSGSAVVDSTGTVYFGSYDKKLYALDGATGVKKWDYATGDIIRSTTPLLADDGTIYIGSDDGLIHALDSTGKLVRTYATAAPIYTAPIVVAGRLYVTSSDAKLYAFDTGNNPARAPWPMFGHNLRRVARAAALPGFPSITTQPTAPTGVKAGASASLTAGATLAEAGTLTYQWYFNDVAIAGATGATLTLSSAQGSDSGVYRVIAIGPGGSVISRPATLSVEASATDNSRLVNLAIRTTAGGGDRVLFLGYAIGGAGTAGAKPLLIRGVGPTLAGFGVTDTLADPHLQIYSGTNLLLDNDDWAGDAQVAATTPLVGAFALANAASKDAAVVFSRTAGSYTALIYGPGTTSGVVLAEIYDATPTAASTATTPRLINISARTEVGTGGGVLIAGFVIAGTSSKQVLIRAVGPTLGGFGVARTLADPRLDLFRGSGTTAISSNDNWGQATNAPQIAAAAATVGAFALPLESRDAVLLVTLPPGTYTAQVSGVNATTGVALVEVYELP